MGIVIRDALAAVPGPDGIEISRHTIYVAGDLIAGIDEMPAGFSGDEVVEGRNRLVIPGLIRLKANSLQSHTIW